MLLPLLWWGVALGESPAATPVEAPVAPAPPSATANATTVPVPPLALKDELPRLAVSDLTAQGVSPEQAAAMTDAVIASLSNRKLFQVISSRDVQALVSAERRRQLLGICETDPSACALDLGAASDARFVLSGQLARIGSAFQISLQMVDTQKGQPVARSTRLAADLETLRSLVPYAAAEATGSPLPPPPSRILSVLVITAGGGALFSGGVVGLLELAKQQQLNDELCPSGAVAGDRCTGVNLHPRDFYIQKERELKVQQGLALGLMIGGAAIAGVGIWLMPPAERAKVSALLVPQPSGFAVVGAFP